MSIRPLGLTMVLFAAACSSKSHTQPTGSGATMSAAIGASGGTVTVEGTTISVPAGSLTMMTTITITSTTTGAPANISAYSPVYKFAPDGLSFAIPATVRISPIAGAPAGLSVFWSNASGGYDPLATTANGGALEAMVTHFSSGVVGTSSASPMTPATCSAPACGTAPACNVSCTGAMPFALCVSGSMDKMGACPMPSTCTCVANDPARSCSTAPTTVCGAGCTKTCSDPTPYAICIEANIMKVMGGPDACVGPASCTCGSSAPDMTIGGGSGGGGGK